MHHGLRHLSFCLIGLLLVGCGRSGPKTYEVSGTVTWNDEPVADGWINFYPTDGTITPQGGKIRNGEYRFRATPGAKRVQIQATREGAFNPVMQSPERESYIPPPYSGDDSPLSAEVTP